MQSTTKLASRNQPLVEAGSSSDRSASLTEIQKMITMEMISRTMSVGGFLRVAID
jgi:hypothetical protein